MNTNEFLLITDLLSKDFFDTTLLGIHKETILLKQIGFVEAIHICDMQFTPLTHESIFHFYTNEVPLLRNHL
jgi:hypothetical protein